jgi:hypothetical protein
MTEGGAAPPTGRPLCRCHGEPMDATPRRSSTGGAWQCAVKRRERQLAAYRADPASANYARVRVRLRARIARKRAHVEVLEALLHEAQDTR